MSVPESWLHVLVPPLAVAAAVLFWMGVVALVARVGGWRRLAGRYAGKPHIPGEALGLSSLLLSGGLLTTRYNGAVHLNLGPEGLGLSPMVLFRSGHADLLIPWDRVERCERRRLFFSEVTALLPGECGVELLIRGDAGQAVWDCYRRQVRP